MVKQNALRTEEGPERAGAPQENPYRFSPRLQETLALLLEGHSEKEIADRLGLSATTIHQYVTTLYRRFGVQSRAQLMARVLKESGHGPGRCRSCGRSSPDL